MRNRSIERKKLLFCISKAFMLVLLCYSLGLEKYEGQKKNDELFKRFFYYRICRFAIQKMSNQNHQQIFFIYLSTVWILDKIFFYIYKKEI